MPLDYFVLSKTKLNETFPDAQMTLSIQEIRGER